MQVFDFAVLSKLVCQILLGRFFVHASYEHNPAFHGCSGAGRGVRQSCSGLDVERSLQRAALVSEPCVDSTRSKDCCDATPLSFPPEKGNGQRCDCASMYDEHTCRALETSALSSDNATGGGLWELGSVNCMNSRGYRQRTFIDIHLIVRHG